MPSRFPRFLAILLTAPALLGCLGASTEEPSAALATLLAPAWATARDRDPDAILASVGAEGLGTASLLWHADLIVRGEGLRVTLRDGAVVAQQERGPVAPPAFIVDVASVRVGIVDAFEAARATPAHAELAALLGSSASYTGTLVPLASGQYWTILGNSATSNVGTTFAVVDASTGAVLDVGDIGARDPTIPVFGERVVHAQGVLEGETDEDGGELVLTLPRFPPGSRVAIDVCASGIEGNGGAIGAIVEGEWQEIGYGSAQRTFLDVEGPVSVSFLPHGEGARFVKVGYHIDNGRSFERIHRCHDRDPFLGAISADG